MFSPKIFSLKGCVFLLFYELFACKQHLVPSETVYIFTFYSFSKQSRPKDASILLTMHKVYNSSFILSYEESTNQNSVLAALPIKRLYLYIEINQNNSDLSKFVGGAENITSSNLKAFVDELIYTLKNEHVPYKTNIYTLNTTQWGLINENCMKAVEYPKEISQFLIETSIFVEPLPLLGEYKYNLIAKVFYDEQKYDLIKRKLLTSQNDTDQFGDLWTLLKKLVKEEIIRTKKSESPNKNQDIDYLEIGKFLLEGILIITGAAAVAGIIWYLERKCKKEDMKKNINQKNMKKESNYGVCFK